MTHIFYKTIQTKWQLWPLIKNTPLFHPAFYQNYEQGRQPLQKKKYFKNQSFQRIIKVSWSPIQIFLGEKKIGHFQRWKKTFAILDKVVHNFGKSDVDMV